MALFQVTTYRTALVTAAFAAASVTLFFVVSSYTGRLVENGGRGWDGAAYLDMLRENLVAQASNERLRPLVVAFNRLVWKRLYRLAEEKYSLSK